MVLFHGSNVTVKKPEIITNGYYKDFGYGFYCTRFEKQARRWALTKKRKHFVNRYKYTENSELKIKAFKEMADDTIWDYIEDYISEKISKAAFWELVKFKYPTHQIVFCTEKALKTLEFEGSYSL